LPKPDILYQRPFRHRNQSNASRTQVTRPHYFPSVALAETSLISSLPSQADLRTMLRLAMPMVLIQVGMMFMGVVDTIMVGHLNAQALAAVALGNLYFWGFAMLAMGTLMAVDPIVTQAVGAGDERSIGRGVQRGIVLAVILSVPIGLLMLPAGKIFTAAHQPAEVVPLAVQYVLWMIPSTVPFFVFIVIRQTLQAMHRTRAIVWSIIGGNGCNALLNWLLIFGHAGFPAKGVVGSAWATSSSRWLMMGMLMAFAWKPIRGYLRPFRRDSVELRPMMRMVALGFPIGCQMFLEFSAFAAIALLMGRLGTIQVAGHQVAINLASLTFMVPLGVGSAATVLVGNAVGRADADQARRGARSAILFGTAFMSCTAILFLVLPGFFAGLYTNDGTVLAVAAALIPIAGVFQVFDGLQAVAAGILRGLGDTRVPMLINIVGFWFLGMPVSIYLGFHAGLGPRGLWWGFVAGLGAVSMLLLVRVRVRLRRDLIRVVIDQEGEPPPLDRSG
jgi:MATE family multidrug resistance protein